MLTRLTVNGFKNLVKLDLRFGPFTCIAGGNAVGKSNIFDVIQFLSLLTEKPFHEAALLLRSEDKGKESHIRQGTNIRDIFHKIGNTYGTAISIEAEMIIPKKGVDELGQEASATYNFLRYSLEFEYREDPSETEGHPIVLKKEELVSIPKSDASQSLLFAHSAKDWRDTALQGRRATPFISTSQDEEGQILINLHQDGGSRGRPNPFLAKKLPRTVLSTANYASETPTVLLAKREMQSWKMLQLEPSSLRKPDNLDQIAYFKELESDGTHLPSTVYKLWKKRGDSILVELANRLSELMPDIRSISIDKDEKRQLLSLIVTSKDGTPLPAKSLSDGTLRFLALAVLDLDYIAGGVLCLEEPENGIHPERIPEIIELLQHIPVDVDEEDGMDNPLRQVIINTHSPRVVLEIPDSSLVYVDSQEVVLEGTRCKIIRASALSDTWRTKRGEMNPISKGKLLSYFNANTHDEYKWLNQENKRKITKVKDREDLQSLQGNLFAE